MLLAMCLFVKDCTLYNIKDVAQSVLAKCNVSDDNYTKSVGIEQIVDIMIPSDPNFIIKYLDEMPSDDDSDDDFDGYISEDDSILADSSTLSSSNSSSTLSSGSSSSSNSSSTLTNQLTPNFSSGSSLPFLAISGGPLQNSTSDQCSSSSQASGTLTSHFGT